jgi:hypothetical protein
VSVIFEHALDEPPDRLPPDARTVYLRLIAEELPHPLVPPQLRAVPPCRAVAVDRNLQRFGGGGLDERREQQSQDHRH